MHCIASGPKPLHWSFQKNGALTQKLGEFSFIDVKALREEGLTRPNSIAEIQSLPWRLQSFINGIEKGDYNSGIRRSHKKNQSQMQVALSDSAKPDAGLLERPF